MRPSRRDVLRGIGAAGVLPACAADPDDSAAPAGPPQPAPDRAPEPPPWDPGVALDEVAFPASVQAGDPVDDGVLLSVRTTEPELALIVMAGGDGGWTEHERREGLVPIDGIVQLELTGLAAETVFAYVFTSADGARRSPVGRFRTAPGTAFRKITFGATSCFGSINEAYASAPQVVARAPDFFLLLGDTIYADGAVTRDDYRAEWDAQLASPAVREMFAGTAVIATWDDHEVDNDWVLGETVTAEQVDAAKAEFRAAIPMRVGPGGSGLWRLVRFGDQVDVFVLDSRGERDGDARMVSDEQLAWAIDGLAASTAAFKLVLCSVHLTDHAALMGPVAAHDRWQGFPEQRDQLVAALCAIDGAVVITGDMHYGGVQWLGPPGVPGDDIPEIAAGPTGSRIDPIATLLEMTVEPLPQYALAIDTWSSCWFEADPGTGVLVVEFVDDAGAVLARQELQVAAPRQA